MTKYFVRFNQEEAYRVCDGKLIFYPSGQDEPIELSSEQVMRIYKEAYLGGLVEFLPHTEKINLKSYREILTHG